MNTLRLALTDELESGLDFLVNTEYPTLSKAEIAKLLIGKEIIRSKRKQLAGVGYDDSELLGKELLMQAARVFGVTKNNGESDNFDVKKLKPMVWTDNV